MNMNQIKPALIFVSILSFIVSLVFTIQLLSSQATTESDKALFSGLAISAELGKVILFSIGMLLLFVVSNRKFAWMGIPVLIISLSFTILSVIGTIGALQTKNAEKTEASILNSDKYNLLKSQIKSLEEQAKQLRSTAAGQPSIWKTHNDAIQSAQKAEEKKAELLKELQSMETTGTGAQNALYVALAKWTGETVEAVKFKVMASYGIAIEALALFCALFAFFGEYIIGNRKVTYYEETDNTKQKVPEYRKGIEEMPAHHNKEEYRFLNQSFTTETNTGFVPQAEPITFGQLAKKYIDFSYQGKNQPLIGKQHVAKEIGTRKENLVIIAKILEKEGLIQTRGTETFPAKSLNEIYTRIDEIERMVQA